MRAGAVPAEVEFGSPSEDAMCLERVRFPLNLKPLYAKRTFLTELLAED